EKRIIEWRNTTFYSPDTKKIIVLCAGEDITEYIKTNAALRESETKFRSLADDALVGIFLVQDWHYVFANKYLAEILGYSVEELLNLENWIDVVAPGERPILIMAAEGMLSDKQSQRREIHLQRKDGKLIEVDGISALTEYKGKPALIGTVVDITEKKALERQKEDFFAMATHDLKSPLTVIMSCSEMLVKKCQQFDENTKRFIDLIHGSSRKLFHLVEDFLSVTQLEAGRLTPKIAPSDIHLILREAQAELEKEAQEKGIHFYMEIPKDLPQQISVDPNLVQRAVFNLLQNSVNYTQPGGSIILKAEWNASEDRDFLLISVKDTGKGISPEEQESIFEKYYRSPRTAGIKGTGLGLTIVKAVAEAHGGFVTVKSEVNKGSTFTLCFPLALKMKQRA
ncbi:MAG: PAS domain-containing sensor histidine kinase, partial [Bdellovibrionia bacterium]